MSPWFRRFGRPLAAFLIVSAGSAACSGGGQDTVAPPPPPPAPPAPTVAQVLVTPTTATLRVGESVTLSGQPVSSTGTSLSATVSWSSSNATVATVDATGRVSAVASGTATMTATAGAGTGTSVITVLAPVATVTITPDSLLLATGDAGTLTATPRDAAGNILVGRTVQWSTDAPATATVSATGVVTAVGAGRALIIATSEARADTAAVRVITPESRLVFDRAPAHIRPGFGLGLTVRATRTGLDTIKTFNGTVTLQDSTGANSLFGTVSTAAREGIAVFDEAAFSTAGTYRLRATASGTTAQIAAALTAPIIVSATSTLPTITVGSVSRTALTTGVIGTSRYRIPVTLRDSAGVAAPPTVVTVRIDRGQGTILSGATSVTTANGSATFELVIQGSVGVDLLVSAPGFQPRVQSIASPLEPAASYLNHQRNIADSVVAVGNSLTTSATLLHSALAAAPIHAVTYELSWNASELTLTGDSTATSASYTINRTRIAEGVLRVSVANASEIIAAGRSQLLHRFTFTVRTGASGTQQLRLVTLDMRGPSGELLAPRRTVDLSFRIQ